MFLHDYLLACEIFMVRTQNLKATFSPNTHLFHIFVALQTINLAPVWWSCDYWQTDTADWKDGGLTHRHGQGDRHRQGDWHGGDRQTWTETKSHLDWWWSCDHYRLTDRETWTGRLTDQGRQRDMDIVTCNGETDMDRETDRLGQTERHGHSDM